jgi:hypothetical protein
MKYQLCNVKVIINYHVLATPNLSYLVDQKMETPITFFTFGSLRIVAILMRVDTSYGGSKAARVLVPKVHINGKINTRMEKKH